MAKRLKGLWQLLYAFIVVPPFIGYGLQWIVKTGTNGGTTIKAYSNCHKPFSRFAMRKAPSIWCKPFRFQQNKRIENMGRQLVPP